MEMPPPPQQNMWLARPNGTRVNPRPTGTPDFPSPTRGRSNPRLSRLLLVVEKNGKKRSKARQKWLRNYFNHFFAKVKIVASRAKKWPNFRVYRDCQTSFRKTSIISGNMTPFPWASTVTNGSAEAGRQLSGWLDPFPWTDPSLSGPGSELFTCLSVPPDGGTLRHVNNSLLGPLTEGSVHGNGSRQPDNWLSALAEPFITVLAHGNGVNICIFVCCIFVWIFVCTQFQVVILKNGWDMT